MSHGYDELDALLESLVRLRQRAGHDVYDRALQAARVSVAKVVLSYAERIAARRFTDNVLRFRRYPRATGESEDNR